MLKNKEERLMDLEQKKRQNLKALGFKPRSKKPCDPK